MVRYLFISSLIFQINICSLQAVMDVGAIVGAIGTSKAALIAKLGPMLETINSVKSTMGATFKVLNDLQNITGKNLGIKDYLQSLAKINKKSRPYSCLLEDWSNPRRSNFRALSDFKSRKGEKSYYKQSRALESLSKSIYPKFIKKDNNVYHNHDEYDRAMVRRRRMYRNSNLYSKVLAEEQKQQIAESLKRERENKDSIGQSLKNRETLLEQAVANTALLTKIVHLLEKQLMVSVQLLDMQASKNIKDEEIVGTDLVESDGEDE